MNTILPLLRAWLARLNPRRRRALAKRDLESICRQAGCSRSQARRITSEYFK